MTVDRCTIADLSNWYGLDSDLAKEFGLDRSPPSNHDRHKQPGTLLPSRQLEPSLEWETNTAGRSSWILDADLEVERRG